MMTQPIQVYHSVIQVHKTLKTGFPEYLFEKFYVAVKSAPPVVVGNLSLEDELPQVVGSGRGRGRANPKSD